MSWAILCSLQLCPFSPQLYVCPASPPVSGHCALLLGGQMFVFGGLGPSGQRSNGLYAYNFSANTWAPLNTTVRPLSRAYHGQAWGWPGF